MTSRLRRALQRVSRNLWPKGPKTPWTALAVVVALGALAGSASARTAPPVLTSGEARLMTHRLAARVSTRVDHYRRELGPCRRLSPTAVDCTVRFFDREKAGAEVIETVRSFKVSVRKQGRLVHGRIVQTDYQEAT